MARKLVRIAPDGTVTETPVLEKKGPGLELLHSQVGGYIELVRVRYEGKVRDAYVDEDGLSKGLAPNPHAMAIAANPHNLVGPIVIWIPS